MPPTNSPETEPIACALSPNELRDRSERWQSLSDRALMDVSEEAGRLTARYRAEKGIAARLAELIEAEKECCPFLHFEMTHQEEIVSVVLTYPPEAADLIPVSAPKK
ncbi:MAG: hypothetical protein ACRDHO_06015 [Actinomycetota bacterium]